MSVQRGAPSLEPYLRARAIDPTLIPSGPLRPARSQVKDGSQDFIEFLRKLSRLALSPITIPARIIHQTLTSPLTLSLILKLILLIFLVLSSAIFSILAVGAFWYSWGTGGAIEVEGWLFYGSKTLRTPHTLVQLPINKFQEDLRYDVELEMELVRPTRGAEEMGNFMLSLELRSQRNPELTVLTAAQPSLPPLPLALTVLPIPSLAFSIPCFLPWPIRGLCPSRLLGYEFPEPNDRKNAARRARARAGPGNPVTSKDVVMLTKSLMEGVVIKPGRGGDAVVGAAFVSIGREDSFSDSSDPSCNQAKEIRTTGWVVIRFIPRPTGVRWILSSHPLPPLLLLPPISLGLTLSSALLAFLIINYLSRSRPSASSKSKSKKPKSTIIGGVGLQTAEERLLQEKRSRVFEDRDKEEEREAERRKKEWEEVESSASGLRKMPEGMKRGSSSIGQSTIGGSETTVPSGIQSSFAPIPERSEDAMSDTTAATETATESGMTGERSRRPSEVSDGWESTE